ncbi:hypothetical protein F4678DRAFT_442137 [Xylaria arbuscula]|nr:hypothetical protein F4678DRAFT_442137 [Xylaria arbuscula]
MSIVHKQPVSQSPCRCSVSDAVGPITYELPQSFHLLVVVVLMLRSLLWSWLEEDITPSHITWRLCLILLVYIPFYIVSPCCFSFLLTVA